MIIIKEATSGYENAAPVIFQGHMDMVCEKAPDCDKDMATEGLDLVLEDGCVRAKGTTLGGDDGIAVAFALAILDADDISHPRFEAVFTVDEEVGMEGAAGLDNQLVEGHIRVLHATDIPPHHTVFESVRQHHQLPDNPFICRVGTEGGGLAFNGGAMPCMWRTALPRCCR